MKKILTAEQQREADRYTIENEPVSSIDLMERAAQKCTDWLVEHYDTTFNFSIYCGPGNNGGDGMAIARMLCNKGYAVKAFGIGTPDDWSADRRMNTDRFADHCKGNYISSLSYPLEAMGEKCVLVDALFGSGLSRPLHGEYSELVKQLNALTCDIVSIDLPSGLSADNLPAETDAIIFATHTLTFQTPKRTFFFPSSGKYTGDWYVLDIDLHADYMNTVACSDFVPEFFDIKQFIKPRKKFSHKGNYGHGLLVAGGKGKSGAALLATRACLRSGIGLLTVHVPSIALDVLQFGAPEAMVNTDSNADSISDLPELLERFSAIGIGPGIGTASHTAKAVHQVLMSDQPLVIDADALNILSENKEWLRWMNGRAILTPHPKEFERLAGVAEDDIGRHELQRRFSMEHDVVVVLKGAHTCITTPDGQSYFNTTGNAGLAKGGSGDVLTGIILAFLSQGYSPEHSALLGVWCHGAAADLVATEKSMEGMLPSDVIEALARVVL
jgi:NAD(P)H-hydrate epimerase